MSSSENNVRKKIINQKKKNQINKKVATGDKDNDPVSPVVLSGNISLITKEATVEFEKNEKEPKNKEQRIKELQEKNFELENQLNYLKTEYESKKLGDIENFQTINNELEQKNEIVNKVAKKNKKLIIQLKNIEDVLKENYTKAIHIKHIKKLEYQRSEKKVQKDIDVIEKEIENSQKIVERTKREKKRFQQLLNNLNNRSEQNLKDELEAINNKTEKIRKQIEQLTLIKLKHISCKTKIQNLKTKLNLINNDIEFESKKTEMMSTIINNKDNKKLNKSSEKSIEFMSNQMLYSKHIRDNIIKKISPKLPKVSKSVFNYIKTEFSSVEKNEHLHRIISKDNIRKPISLLGNVFQPETCLFTDREEELLNKLIPKNYMSKYKQKFNVRKTEKEETENKFEEFKEKNNNILQIKYKIDFIKLNIKSKQKDKTGLMIKFKNNKKKILNLLKEISEYKKKIKKENDILKRMNKYNKMYSDNIEKIKNKKV